MFDGVWLFDRLEYVKPKPEVNANTNMTENFSLKALVGLSDVDSYHWAKSIKY